MDPRMVSRLVERKRGSGSARSLRSRRDRERTKTRRGDECCGVALGQGARLALGTTFSRLSTTQPVLLLHPRYLR
jgi:hypothetical protein